MRSGSSNRSHRRMAPTRRSVQSRALMTPHKTMTGTPLRRAHGGAPDEPGDCFAALADARRTILPKRLGAPGPDASTRLAILRTAASAPDHGRLLPWRFIEIPEALRPALARAFEQALRARDPAASDADAARAREKAHRAPWLMLSVVRTAGGDPEIPAQERLVSAGCAIQNLLLAATAHGYGSALTSGKALESVPIRALFGLADEERALCFLNVGTVIEARPIRSRPAVSDYHSVLPPPD